MKLLSKYSQHVFLITVILYLITNIIKIVEDLTSFFAFYSFRMAVLFLLLDFRIVFVMIATLIACITFRQLTNSFNQKSHSNYLILIFFTILSGVQLAQSLFKMSYFWLSPSIYGQILIAIVLFSTILIFINNKSNKKIEFYDIDKFSSQLLIPSLSALFIALGASFTIALRLVDLAQVITITAIPTLMIITLKSIKIFFLNNSAFTVINIVSTIAVVIIYISFYFYINPYTFLPVNSLENLIFPFIFILPFIFINVAYAYYGKKEGENKKTFTFKSTKFKSTKLKSNNDHSLFE